MLVTAAATFTGLFEYYLRDSPYEIYGIHFSHSCPKRYTCRRLV